MKFSELISRAVQYFQPSRSEPTADPISIDADRRSVAQEIPEESTRYAVVSMDEPEEPWYQAEAELNILVNSWDQNQGSLTALLADMRGLDVEYDALNNLHLLESDQLQSTVPEAYRGMVHEAPRDHAESDLVHAENSLAFWTQSAQILAIDQAGIALVYRNVTWEYEGADGPSFEVLPKEDAFKLLDNFQASHEIVKSFQAQGLRLPHDFDYSDPTRLHLGHPEHFSEVAMPGQTYRGPIESIEHGHAIQRISESSTVAHDLKCLVGMDVSQSLGIHVEIRYPQGQVGIVGQDREQAELGLGDREHAKTMTRGAEFGG